MRHVSLVAAVAVVGLVACSTDSTLQPNQPTLNALIVDGAHAGNPNFFFLPPLVPNPVGSPNYDAGKFNARLSPFVEVCELTAVDVASLAAAACKSDARVFGPARMGLDASSEQYQLNWDTQASLLNPSSFYRVIVRGAARGTILGTLDVDPVVGGMKNAKTGEVYVFQDGRTLPIKVRIEQGAFGATNSSDNVEQVVPAVLPSTGLDVTTNTGFAGAHFSNGWLPDGFDQVVVIIERISPNCLNTPLEQLEGCYRFRTDPDLHGLGPRGTDLTFAIPVVAGICFQFPGDIGNKNEHPFELMRSEEILVENELRVTPAVPLLDEQPAPFLHCDGFGATPPSIGAAFRSRRIGDIAKAGLYAVTRAIGRALEPKALHAVDFGAGGSTNEFSRFGYARQASMTVTSGDGATAPAGTTITAAVRVQNNHHEGTEQAETSPVVGQSVTFTVPTGEAGTVSIGSCSEEKSCAATTGTDGVASVTWRLAAGTNTLQVTTTQVTNSPRTITATGGIPTTTALASGVPLAAVGFTVPLRATVTPAPAAGSPVEFFEGTTSLGTASTNVGGQATLSVTLSSSLGRQFFTAKFLGTATHAASTSSTAVQEKWQVFSDLASFSAALGDATAQTQDFAGMTVGTPVSSIITGVLNVSSSFPNLEVFDCTGTLNCLFGFGGTVRQTGGGRYDLAFPASRNALAFDIVAQDPATGPATIQIITSIAGLALGKSNPNSETTPNFFGIILTVPIQSAAVLEGPEVSGTGNEEIALDNFVVASVPFTP